jgi:hypothetical protein
MQQLSLNNLYNQYVNGVIGRKEFEGMIYKTIIRDQRRYNLNRWKQEESDDFVSWLYPRIHSAIDSYREKGASFEAYMNTIVRLSAKEYRRDITNNSITEYTAWAARVSDLYTRQEEPDYSEEESRIPESAKQQTAIASAENIKNPRQLVILILKCYYYVSDDFLERIAPKAGISKENLKEMIDRLSIVRAKREEELRNIRERVYSQFYRCIIYDKKLSLLPENSIAASKMKLRLEKARLRLETMRKRLTKIRADATNSQVAKIIGISKGAVDASLHSLKARWSIKADKSLLN